MQKANFSRMREWLQTITMLDGDALTHLAKLEYEAGIDVESIADGLKLQCNDNGCAIVSNFRAYAKKHYEHIEVNPAGDRFLLAGKWYQFNSESKLIFLRRMIVQAMRSVPKMTLYRFRADYLAEQAVRNSKALKGAPETFADIYKLDLKL